MVKNDEMNTNMDQLLKDLADFRYSFAGQMLEFPATSLFVRTDWSLVGFHTLLYLVHMQPGSKELEIQCNFGGGALEF
jgi:hypothetical protein